MRLILLERIPVMIFCRENLEYLTGGATAATNSVALLDMEPHPHVSQGEAYEMQAVGQPILPENPVKWL